MGRLLMISHQYPPLVSIATVRLLRFLRHLGSEGWMVDLITARPERYRVRDVLEVPQGIPGVRVFRESCLPEVDTAVQRKTTWLGDGVTERLRKWKSLRTTSRVVREWIPVISEPLSWQWAATRVGRRLMEADRYDCLYSSSGPLAPHRAAASLARRSGVPWVAEFRDAVVENPYHPKPTLLHLRYFLSQEARIVGEASGVVVTTRTHADLLRLRYGDGKRITVIPNGYDPVEYGPDEGGLPDRFTLIHGGNLYGSRSIQPLLLGWREWLRDRSDQSPRPMLLFYGRAFNLDLSRFLMDHELTDTVKIMGVQRHQEVLAAMKRAHASVVIKSAGDRIHIPGKLYEGLGSGRPVLLLGPPSEASELVEGLRAGVWVESTEPRAIARALDCLASWPAGALAGREDYRADNLARRLARFLEETAKVRVSVANPPLARVGAGR